MKVLTNRPEPALLRGVASLLVRALAAEPGELFLVSPWLKDVRLPTAAVGSFRAALGGDLDEIPLADLLERAARRHRVCLITKPPAELVDLTVLKRIAEKAEVRRRVVEHMDLAGLDITEELAGEIDADVAELARSAAVHADTLRLGQRLRSAGAQVFCLDRLHAKLLWTPQGALVGSANFTNGGLISNEELMLEVTDGSSHASLLEAVKAMVARSTPAERFRLRQESERAGLSPDFLTDWAANPKTEDPPSLTDILRLIAPFL